MIILLFIIGHSYYLMLKNFCVFIFRRLLYQRKLINDENFPIYGINTVEYVSSNSQLYNTNYIYLRKVAET